MTNYVSIAMESLIGESVIWRNNTVSTMLAESEFILSSLENGMIADPVLEANISETAKKIINALKMFLNDINAKFKEKVAKYYERYVPWVQKNADRIREEAKGKTDPIELAPFWNGKTSEDIKLLTNLPGDAFKYPFSSEDVSFATNILPFIKTPADMEDTPKLTNILKNKFRFGVEEEDDSKIKRESLKGDDLAKRVDQMINYVTSYNSISQSLTKISNSWTSSAEKFHEAVGEAASVLGKDTFLLVEMSALCSTDLALLEGFDKLPESVIEEDDNKSESTALTTVTDTGAGKNDGDNVEKKPSHDSKSRYRLADKFTRIAFSSFMTACEERFIVYIKVMSKILGESPKGEKQQEKK